ncbi:MAG: Antidote-toxin recognition MazE, bacterial antitoxin [Sphingomonadales bacterium]|jgi:antitoxin VapB|nr:Antidote-toxin recognition MazE, bacterial antitoxin [Sphingomonadales bacterium]
MGAVTKTFKSGNSVAVRLPRELGIEAGVEVELEDRGNCVLIRRRPKYTGRDLVEALAKLPLPQRPMGRQRIVFPKRRGLS